MKNPFLFCVICLIMTSCSVNTFYQHPINSDTMDKNKVTTLFVKQIIWCQGYGGSDGGARNSPIKEITITKIDNDTTKYYEKNCKQKGYRLILNPGEHTIFYSIRYVDKAGIRSLNFGGSANVYSLDSTINYNFVAGKEYIMSIENGIVQIVED